MCRGRVVRMEAPELQLIECASKADSGYKSHDIGVRQKTPAEPLNMNHYATKKSVAESMLDVALLMANASQLKAVLEQGPEFKYFLTVIILIAASLFFQVLAGVLFVNMARKNLNDVVNQRKLDIMNNVATGLVFITVIINIFITAFGVQKTGLYPKQ
ncbi:ninjurin-2 isoform X5 [Megalobrama amblycephala]|uniref:ninjurin-2 isoform X5 n=1 Tax=Megalobrama amblycephala TaxID=75352 RepID=UPI002014712A|nr:ninjurin-2 isoform X5 [Megalobrama amblycephala]